MGRVSVKPSIDRSVVEHLREAYDQLRRAESRSQAPALRAINRKIARLRSSLGNLQVEIADITFQEGVREVFARAPGEVRRASRRSRRA